MALLITFYTTHHHPPLNFLKALKAISCQLYLSLNSFTPFLPSFALPLPYLVPVLSLSCPSCLVPVLSLCCPFLVPVLSLPCPCLVLNLLPLPSWNLELDPEALGLVFDYMVYDIIFLRAFHCYYLYTLHN